MTQRMIVVPFSMLCLPLEAWQLMSSHVTTSSNVASFILYLGLLKAAIFICNQRLDRSMHTLLPFSDPQHEIERFSHSQ